MANLTPIPVEHVNSGRSPWHRMVNAWGKGHTVFFFILLAWILICGIYLATADTPWEASIIRRMEAGKSLKDEHLEIIALWWGAVINVGISVLLLCAAPLWARKLPVHSGAFEPGERSPGVDWVVTIGLLILVTIAAGVMRATRLNDSFTNDEEMAWRQNAHGYWKADEDGTVGFKPISWSRTIYTNHELNNHTLQTVASRAANTVWQKLTGRADTEFSEIAIRMPVFIAGLGSVMLIGVLGTVAGNSRVGIGAAVLLALSPWHLRYAVEGRGYGVMILLVIVALLASIMAIDRRQLRWWLLFGACQAGYLLAFPGAAYVAVAHCIVILVSLLGLKRQGTLIDVSQFLVGGFFCVMLFFSTQFVAVGELAESLHETQDMMEPVNLGWVLDFLSHLTAGIPWIAEPPAFHNGISAQLGWDGQPYYVWVVIVVFPLMAVLGLGHMAVSGWRQRIVAIPVAAGAVIATGQSMLHGSTLFSWYVIYALIPFAICVSWAADRVAPPRTRHYGWFLLLCLGLYVLTVAEPLHLIGTYQRQPMLQVAEVVRGRGHPDSPPQDAGLITATFGTSDRQMLSYDPLVRFPESAADVDDLIKEASDGGKSLIVYFCDDKRAARETPDLLERIAKSPDFEQKGVYKGLEAMFRYSVYEWKDVKQ
ncbi:MAG: glycosyltransferase family 39 protein [Verrucomicrobiae bacterium]|nr:glycosyltransferase family 39 protein [Verrucomicrobiae bacterium]